MRTESIAIDRIAVALMVLFGLGTALWVFLAVGYGTRGNLVMVVVAWSVSLLFGLQTWGFSRSIRAVVQIDDDSAARIGPGSFRWSVARADLLTSEVRTIWGAPYLVLVARGGSRKGFQSRFFLPGVPRGAVAVPLAPSAVAAVSAALGVSS